MITHPSPGPEVLAAFGVDPNAAPRRLHGGQGTAWRADHVVLKPSGEPVETSWRARVLEQLANSTTWPPMRSEFRVARPIRTRNDGWVAHGWEAWHAVKGREDPARPDDVIRAGIAFHRAIAHLPRPGFLDHREGPWSYGDRMAWDDIRVSGTAQVMALLEPLDAARRPVTRVSQPIHGDLLRNVLFSAHLPPAVIDWPVYFRPVAWAAAIVVCDALCWYDASPDLIARWAHLPEWRQMLIRAFIYRIATDDARAGPAGPKAQELDTYRAPVAAVLAMH